MPKHQGGPWKPEYEARRPPRDRARESRNWYLQKHYGITVDEFDRRRDEQDGRCAMCGEEHDLLCVDHDHTCCPGPKSCGECVRGLVCVNCNRSLGVIENAEIMAAADTYLARYRV